MFVTSDCGFDIRFAAAALYSIRQSSIHIKTFNLSDNPSATFRSVKMLIIIRVVQKATILPQAARLIVSEAVQTAPEDIRRDCRGLAQLLHELQRNSIYLVPPHESKL